MTLRACLFLAVVGCGGSPADVTGRVLSTCFQAGGDVDVATDLSQRGVRARVGDRVVEGTGRADGSFVIPGVPDEAYLLELDPPGAGPARRFVTDQRTVEIRDEHVGRCAPPPVIAGLPMVVRYDLTGVTDGRLWFGSLAGGWRTSLSPGHPVTGHVNDSFLWPGPKVDAAQGDDLYVVAADVSHVAFGNETVVGATRWVSLTGTSIDDVQETAVAATLPPVEAPVQTGSVAIDPAAFAPGAAEVRIAVLANPWSAAATSGTEGAVNTGNEVVAITASVRDQALAVPYTYRDPFPAAWHRSVMTSYVVRRYVALHNALPNMDIQSVPGGYEDHTPDRATPSLMARVSPPTALTVNGGEFDAGGKLAFGGAPLTLQWTAAPGAQLYEVGWWYHVEGQREPVVETVTTAETSVRLPWALFQAGRSYTFSVAAIATPTDYAAGQLVPELATRASFRVVSGRFRPMASCGDGVVQVDEECDTAGESAACNADCTIAYCYDGIVNRAAGETCEPLNDLTCSTSCTPRL